MYARKAVFLFGALRSWKLQREDLRKLQFSRLRPLLERAFSNVPFYRSRFREVGLSPGHIRNVSDLARLPLVTRQEVVSSFPDGITDKVVKGRLKGTGTGTTGNSLSMLWSEEQWDAKDAFLLRRYLTMGIKPWNRIVSVRPPEAQWRKLGEGSKRFEATTVATEVPFVSVMGDRLPTFKFVTADPDDLPGGARKLATLKPDFLLGRASVLRRLGLALESQGAEVSPRALICGNEFFSKPVGDDLVRIFRSRVLRAYGSMEFGPIGGECWSKKGIHLHEDFVVVEVIKDGVQVGPGEVGELVFTSLYNSAMPLIRYRSGDYARLADDGVCECGSSTVRVGAILGRKEDTLIAADGSEILPIDVADGIEAALGIRDYQIVQVGRDEFILKLPGPTGKNGEVTRAVERHLASLVGTPVRVTLTERSGSEVWAKNRPVVRKVQRRGT